MAKKKKITIDFNALEKQIFAMVEPLALQCACELIDVEYVLEASNRYLRIYIDREIAVDHDLCQQLSELVSLALDENDPIDENYFLEISSPGLERALRRESDFSRFSGQRVAVKLYAPQDGVKEFFGELVGLVDESIIIETENGQLSFAAATIAKVNLAPLF